MKFYCDSCQTKYSIADEKIRGKVLKVRCKKCSHVITVREPSSPAGGESRSNQGGQRQGPTAAPRSPSMQWHYSINGQSFGPLEQEALAQKFATGELGDAAYVWNESFTDWKRVTEVGAFSDALKKAQSVRPSPKTHGVSQALEAISPEEYDRKQTDANRSDSVLQGDSTSAGPRARAGKDEESVGSRPSVDKEEKKGNAEAAPGQIGGGSTGTGREESAPDRQEQEGEVSPRSGPQRSEGGQGAGLLDKLRDKKDQKGPRDRRKVDEEPTDETKEDAGLPAAVRKLRDQNRKPEDDEQQKSGDRLEKLRDRLQLGSPKAEQEDVAARDTEAPTSDVDEEPTTSEWKPEQQQEPSEAVAAGTADEVVEKSDDEKPSSISESPAPSGGEADSVTGTRPRPDSSSSQQPDGQKAPSEKDDDSGLFGSLFGDSSPEPQQDEVTAEEHPEVDVAHAETLAPEELDDDGPKRDAEASSVAMPSPSEDSVHDGLFGAEGESGSGAVAPAPESPDEQESEDEDAVPFFPSAPKLEKEDSETSTTISRVDEVTDSLLIQLDELKSDGRKQAVVAGIGIVAALSVVGTVVFFGLQSGTTDVDVGEGGSGTEVYEGAFGQRALEYELDEEVVLDEDEIREVAEAADTDEDEDAAEPQEEAIAEADPGSSGQDGDLPDIDTGDFGGELPDDALEGGDSAEGGGLGGDDGGSVMADEDSSMGGLAELDPEGQRFGDSPALADDTELEVVEAEGVGVRELQEGLTPENHLEAAGRISERVSRCERRHYDGGGSDLGEDSIEIQFNVLPEGGLDQFEMVPGTLDDTRFGECLKQDKQHWNYYPPFEGKAVPVQMPFSLSL